MGLDVYLVEAEGTDHENPWDIETHTVPSEKHPDHLFSKTYLRSSYNDGGFNRTIYNNIGITLEDIFEPCTRSEVDVYALQPTEMELFMCRENANNAYKKFMNSDKVKAVSVSDLSDGATTLEEAMELYRQEIKSGYNGFSSYSNQHGMFFIKDPAKVRAIIPGQTMTGRMGVHVLMDMETAFYEQAFEVLIEFIDHALTMTKPTLLWSG